MSKDTKQDDIQNEVDEVNEPWEQPIYDTDGEEMVSRSQKRHKKKSNTTFITTVLILIFLIVAIPISAGVWGLYEKNKPIKPKETPETSISSTIESTSSSTVESSTVESSSEVTEESSSEIPTPPVEEPEKTPEEVPTPVEPTPSAAEYIEVLAGEGPNAVADRAGISVDELYRLNGMDANNFHLSPGQQLKIR